jgi:hypothetical protein
MRTVVGLYDQFEEAQQAARALVDEGFPRDNISLIASDANGEYSRHLPGIGDEKGEGVGSGAAAGAGVGAATGGIAGLLAGLGALAIPGIGPVVAAGPIAAALAGAGIGAAAGSLLGALVKMGIPDDRAKLYEEGIRRGGTLVTVSVENNMSDQAVKTMNRFHPIDINYRSQTWRQDQTPAQRESIYNKDRGQEENLRDRRESVPVTGTPADVQIPGERVDAEDWLKYDNRFRGDFQTRYGSSGYSYDRYMPAYRFGYELRHNPNNAGKDWTYMEPIARREWELRGYELAWEDIKDAVRYAWDSVYL